MYKFTIFSSLIFFSAVIYNGLDPFSISQQLAYYELYPDTPEGKKAIARAWELLNTASKTTVHSTTPLPASDITAFISLVANTPNQKRVILTEEQLALIEQLGSSLPNRKLAGHQLWTKEGILALPEDQIDLSRALLLDQFDDALAIRQYEAAIDLMALQILSRLTPSSKPEDKIREINRFIFQEMQFRFPPLSLHAKDIDLYTFLPSVLDQRQGVCLGVSILYLCIAQRIDLSLEIITPPGHIYLRYNSGSEITNIETTARGINLPSDHYLSINTHLLSKRTLKEVVGMAYVNHASVAWGKEDYQAATTLYEKALLFLPDDPLLQMLLGFNYLFLNRVDEGKKLLEQIRNIPFPWEVAAESMPEDYLSGKVDIAGLKAIFGQVDETRDSIVKKQEELKAVIKRYPEFRAGLLHLAVTWLQLGRTLEAMQVLQRYHKIDPKDPTVEYYLTVLALERYDFNLAWKFLNNTEALVAAKDHHPKALRQLQMALRQRSPQPIQ